MWHPESNFINITSDIFRKEKRAREEDLEDDKIQKLFLKWRGQKTLHRLYLDHKTAQKCRSNKPLTYTIVYTQS
jgi:hypothetical protein